MLPGLIFKSSVRGEMPCADSYTYPLCFGINCKKRGKGTVRGAKQIGALAEHGNHRFWLWSLSPRLFRKLESKCETQGRSGKWQGDASINLIVCFASVIVSGFDCSPSALGQGAFLEASNCSNWLAGDCGCSRVEGWTQVASLHQIGCRHGPCRIPFERIHSKYCATP